MDTFVPREFEVGTGTGPGERCFPWMSSSSAVCDATPLRSCVSGDGGSSKG